jgi:hypothetical protein
MIPVVLVDHYGAGVDLVPIAHALERQAQEHFAPLYGGIAATVGLASSALAGAWTIGLFRDADQPGALGYHSEGPNGLPFAKVFPELDKQDVANLSTTIGHELLEMLADPFLRLAVQSTDGRFYAYEACDPVEQDEYEIDGVKVSNFVTSSWYCGGSQFDYLGLCTKPLEVRSGGYAQWFDASQGWQQIVSGQMRAYRRTVAGRGARRAAL